MEKPCHTLCDLPLLKENSTASAIGTIDQIRYSQVNPSRNHGMAPRVAPQPRQR